MIFRHTPEVKVHVYGEISGQKYEFPAFTGKITHAHTVCTRSFLLLLKGPGYEARHTQNDYCALAYATMVTGITRHHGAKRSAECHMGTNL